MSFHPLINDVDSLCISLFLPFFFSLSLSLFIDISRPLVSMIGREEAKFDRAQKTHFRRKQAREFECFRAFNLVIRRSW